MGGRFRIGGRSVLAAVGAVVCCLAVVAGAQAALEQQASALSQELTASGWKVQDTPTVDQLIRRF